MTFAEWVAEWRVGPGMNDRPGTKLYSGHDGTVGDGWVPILQSLAADLVAMGWDRQVLQIKEKFGGLRFYFSGTDEMHERVRVAEAQAEVTCEGCGAPGKQRDGGWIKTLCDEHAASR
jgi:hypothetical protein